MTDEISLEVFIKNIPYSINERDLSEWCSSFGLVTKCVVVRDRFGNSRGFAFVTYATIEGHNKILSEGPHYCQNRLLVVRTAHDKSNTTEDQSNSSSDQLISTNENIHSTTMDTSLIYDDDHHNRLASLRDEFDANIECMQIAHERELKILREKLVREKKLRDEAEELYREAEEDWRKVSDENVKLRTSLIKNIMQTFNIRRDFARRTKEQLEKCAQIQTQLEDLQSNRINSKKS